ncbi:MAG TPA: response regulator transcription factor [Thermoanaerobaculia bacterium]|nr:response regulator transcription factor [Thermoanaerobaculia bacterium]
MRLLVVEDDPRLSEVLVRGLREDGYAVDSARDGLSALEQLATNSYDAVVLDILIPTPNGLEVCRQMRAAKLSTPVLMLTARDAIEDRVSGLDCGADDYLVKPFAFNELLARIRALLRRAPVATSPVIRIADLTIDTAAHHVQRGTDEIVLTSKEYALLEYLARNPGRVISRAEIAEHVWDENYDPFSNVIDVYVNRLRRKIGDAESRRIVTRRNEGYLLREEEKR